jgi:hypothetical protein
MNAVNVKREELIAVLKKNREAHHAIFLEAQEGYRKAAIAELDVMLQDARFGRRIRRQVSLIEPMDQTAEYDAALAMLTMSVDETITLEQEDFRCYVLDQWRWKGQWSSSNMAYSSSLRNQNLT